MNNTIQWAEHNSRVDLIKNLILGIQKDSQELGKCVNDGSNWKPLQGKIVEMEETIDFLRVSVQSHLDLIKQQKS